MKEIKSLGSYRSAKLASVPLKILEQIIERSIFKYQYCDKNKG